ncbi:MAG: SHOCT domain-containing protein [Acidimicrobiia bacterium]
MTESTPIDMDMTMGPMMGWAWLLAWLLFLAVLVVGIVFLVRSLSDRGDRGGSRAMAILEERFARGEIDLDEFDERKRTLET